LLILDSGMSLRTSSLFLKMMKAINEYSDFKCAEHFILPSTLKILLILLLVSMFWAPRSLGVDAINADVVGTVPPCGRFEVGSLCAAPPTVFLSTDSLSDGILRVKLTYKNRTDAEGNYYYCYMMDNGSQSPTISIQPGKSVELTLYNDLSCEDYDYSANSRLIGRGTLRGAAHARSRPSQTHSDLETHQGLLNAMHTAIHTETGKCTHTTVNSGSTNMHFHGLHIPPECPGDQVMHTVINPGKYFTYQFTVPADHPPGLYWYHPHIFGLADAHTLGGAAGLILIEGIQNVHPEVAGMSEHIIAIRNNHLAASVLSATANDPHDPTPSMDLSINYIPIPFVPHSSSVSYTPPPPRLIMDPDQPQFLRVGNLGADVVLNLQVVYDDVPQQLTVVAYDGVPVDTLYTATELYLPPGGRVEFVMTSPTKAVKHAEMLTTQVNVGTVVEAEPRRTLLRFDVLDPVYAPSRRYVPAFDPNAPSLYERARDVAATLPNVTRRLHFFEAPVDPTNPNSEITFFITVQGQPEQAFNYSQRGHPHGPRLGVTTHAGMVEDWVIENWTLEEHEFHIHQLHFLVVQRDGVDVFDSSGESPLPESFQLRDTINVPAWSGGDAVYPSVTIRMRFGPATVGQFVYHCHILDHEDRGMMAIIKVLPAMR
jgi:FtsP/CotA-like multicopper oxidase with cupredoxin domain